jgi:hypothetical protein
MEQVVIGAAMLAALAVAAAAEASTRAGQLRTDSACVTADDCRLTEPLKSATSMPEPASMILLGTGLFTLAFGLRRLTKAPQSAAARTLAVPREPPHTPCAPADTSLSVRRIHAEH